MILTLLENNTHSIEEKKLSDEFFIVFESGCTILWQMNSVIVPSVSGITNPSHNKSFMT